jgi:benzoyl-CoA reductase/2-hydroxyglutaryl-CoA dehydratase subunit BcrC/BadD/HgdB
LLLDGSNSSTGLARIEGICPYVRSFIGEVMSDKHAAGAVVTTVCDQMRRGFDILARSGLPVFLMNVPSTWQSQGAQKLYIDELERMSRFLIRLGGSSPTDNVLAEKMAEYDSARKSIMKLRPYLSARRYVETIAAFGRDGPGEFSADSDVLTDGMPLAIVGGPMMKKDFGIFDIVGESGGRIVLDATETGDRGMCAPFDSCRLGENPLAELARAYFGGIQDASRRPNSGLYEWFKSEIAGRGVRGIIFHRQIWCDMWHAEVRRMKDCFGMPVLDIDSTGDKQADIQRVTTRIRAFMEMLQ